jgi:hypothetical protein
VQMNADEKRSRAPMAGRLPPPFIGQGEAAYKRVAWIFVQYCSTGVQRLRFDGVLTGPGPRRRRGILCIRRGAASRVLLTEALVLHKDRHGGAPSEQGSTAPGDGSTAPVMVAQGWGWPHWVRGD